MAIRVSATIRLMVGLCVVAFAMPARAQTPPAPDSYAPEPAHLAYLDGAATIEHDGRTDSAAVNVPILAGDRLRTTEGRVEVIFGDGSVLDIDRFTSVDFQSDQLLRLLDGRLRLTIGGRDRVAFRIDTPQGSVRIDSPGDYRVSMVGNGDKFDVELVTYRGYATLLNEYGETQVPAGQRAYATASLAPSYADAYNSAVLDSFDEWAADRRDERTGSTTSASYLPEDVRGYSAVFERYGDWQYDQSYGYVWYPRVVVGWRPYYYGRWNYYGPWGWTWIAHDPWGWPTHHYGHWGYNAGLWFWIPGASWGAAWVYWGSGPGYVGWCPLGWYGGPVIALNVHGGHGWHSAWTVVPHHAFGARGDVSHWAVHAGGDHAVPRGFVGNGTMPSRPAGNFIRASAPIYSAGRAEYAVRRGGIGATTGSAPANTFARPPMSDQPRQYRRGPDGREMPRSTLPPSPGALGQARSRNTDAGPGGVGGYTPRTTPLPSTTGGYQPRTGGYTPRTGGYEPRTAPLPPMTTDARVPAGRRDSGDIGPGGPLPAPPQREASPRYSPPAYGTSVPGSRPGGYERSVPRGEAVPRYSPPAYRTPEANAPGGGSERRAPYSAPGYERGGPRAGEAPRSAPPAGAPAGPRGGPAGGYERSAPERHAPPSTGGGAPARGGEHAAPRGGGGGGGAGSGGNGGGGGHQRRPG